MLQHVCFEAAEICVMVRPSVSQSSCYVPPASIFPYVPLQSSGRSTDKVVGSDKQHFGLTDVDQRRLKGNTALSSLPSVRLLCVASLLCAETGFAVYRNAYKGRFYFLELFQHWGHLAYCILAPNKFPHSSPEAPRIIQMLETSTSEGGNYYQILLANSNLRKSARIFYMPQSWDMGQILLLPLRRKANWGFSGHPKNPTASAGFEPANSGSSGQYANR